VSLQIRSSNNAEVETRLREIVEEPQYREQFESLRLEYERLDEAYESVGLALCRRPDIFPPSPGTDLRRLKIVSYPGIPELCVWFSYDEHVVRLRFIEECENEEPPFEFDQ